MVAPPSEDRTRLTRQPIRTPYRVLSLGVDRQRVRSSESCHRWAYVSSVSLGEAWPEPRLHRPRRTRHSGSARTRSSAAARACRSPVNSFSPAALSGGPPDMAERRAHDRLATDVKTRPSSPIRWRCRCWSSASTTTCGSGMILRLAVVFKGRMRSSDPAACGAGGPRSPPDRRRRAASGHGSPRRPRPAASRYRQ